MVILCSLFKYHRWGVAIPGGQVEVDVLLLLLRHEEHGLGHTERVLSHGGEHAADLAQPRQLRPAHHGRRAAAGGLEAALAQPQARWRLQTRHTYLR